MVLLNSKQLPLHTKIPHFQLPDTDGKIHDSKSSFAKNGLLIAFTCNHCPYAIAVWPRLIELAKLGQDLQISTLAINPNIHPNYPADAPDKMKDKIKEWNISFPYLIDESQNVAKEFDAQCTPDLYLFNSNQELVYHGRIDDNWQEESKVTRQELKQAMQNLANGKEISPEQFPSLGCSIKWK